MRKNFCPHCLPTQRTSHLGLHFDYYLDKIFEPFIDSLPQALPWQDKLWHLFLVLLKGLKLARFTSDIAVTQFHNRSLIFIEEAQKRGLEIKALKLLRQFKEEFVFAYKNKTYLFFDTPLSLLSRTRKLDDKSKIKKLLRQYEIPIAAGDSFTNKTKALSYCQKLSFPLVVKPYSGSLSHHATYPIANREELAKAIDITKEYQPEFIIEEFIPGNLYRASVVGRKHVFICQKERANVVGDGTSSIENLIRQKNLQNGRGDINQKNTTLHHIPFNETLTECLAEQGRTLTSVPNPNQKVYLQTKTVLSFGCDIINRTKETAPENINLFLRIANLLETDLIGIDFICEDIAKPYLEQKSAVIEVNSLPYVDMHQNPSHGESEPVAKLAWDCVLEKLLKKNLS